MFRVSSDKPDRGPLNPLGREDVTLVDRGSWNRFDVGPPPLAPADLGRTIYGASRRDTAFMEVLAWKTATSHTFAGLYEEANFTGSPIDEILTDLRNKGAAIGQVDYEWRLQRKIFTLKTQPEIWIDPTTRGNLEVIAGLAGGFFDAQRRLTVADVTGDDRMITTAIAEILRDQTVIDQDGQNTHIFGIKYGSKFGMANEQDHCWAAWLRGPNSSIAIIDSEPMNPADPDVKTASRITGVFVP